MRSLLSPPAIVPKHVSSPFTQHIPKRHFWGYSASSKPVQKNPGGSYMKWYFVKKYVRHSPNSLYHYPKVSKITGEKIDWLYDTPKSGYEGVKTYGPHTLQLQGMPMGKTPQAMQERLRRFFTKYGPINHCHVLPHPLDPYQCQGTAYISFRSKYAALKALQHPLQFPLSLHSKIVRMRHLDSDKTNDPLWIAKQRHWRGQCVEVARQLYHRLISDEGSCSLRKVWEGLVEETFMPYSHSFNARKKTSVPDIAIYKVFKNWETFLQSKPFDQLFLLEDDTVYIKLVSEEQLHRLLVVAKTTLEKKLQEELSIPWRQDKLALPAWTQERVDFWQHKPHLPLVLQFQSRTKDMYKIYDERLVLKLRMRRAYKERRKEEKKLAKAGGENKKMLATN